jgi:hypothetical protein
VPPLTLTRLTSTLFLGTESSTLSTATLDAFDLNLDLGACPCRGFSRVKGVGAAIDVDAFDVDAFDPNR